MAANKIPADIAKMSFEAAIAELEAIVRQLEAGKSGLEDAIKAYERGDLLRRHCEAKLAEAQLRVEKIVRAPDGTVGSEPVELS